MSLQVVLEQLVLSEGLSTDLTDVECLPAVDLLVPPQSSGSGEALVADVTAEWFDSCVTPHVCLHVLKCLPTDLTGPAAAIGLSVRSEVVDQTVRGLEVSATDSTETLRLI